MAGGRAGVKKMNIGGVAKTAARSAYKAKTAPLQVASMVANKMAPKSKLAQGLKKAATPFKVGGRANKEKMYDVEVDGKMYKFSFDSKPTSAALKKAAKALGPRKGKTAKEIAKEINAQRKKMGGRAGVVKMMSGGDPLSKRGIKMGMSMSPSKNKGKGLYGK